MTGAAGDGHLLSRRERLLVPLAAAAYVAVAFLSEPSFLRGTDFVKDWLPNRAYLHARLLEGELPLWNPYVALGRPFLASIDTTAFYPSTLLNLAIGLHPGVVLATMVHFALGAIWMIALGAHVGLSRPARWLAAAGFLASGHVFIIVHVGSPQYGWGACYMPLVFLLGARLQDEFTARRLALLGLALTLQLLTGWPQIAWITWLGLGAFLLGRAGAGTRAEWLRSAAAGVGGQAAALALAFAASAVQLLPLFELVGQSNRAAPTVAAAAAGGFTPRAWLSLVIPPGPLSQSHILALSFVGVPVLLGGLAGLARVEDRNVRGLAAAALLAALVASGEATPAFRVLFRVVPGLSSFQFHWRTSTVVMMALVLAGGRFLSAEGVWRRSLAVLAAATAGLLAAFVWWHLRVVPAPTRSAGWLAWRCATVIAAGALLAAWHLRGPRGRSWALGGVAVLTVLELGLAIAAVKRYGAFPGSFAGERAVVETLRRDGLFDASGVPPRVAVPYPLIRDNSGEMHGYSTISGYVPLSLDRTWTYLHAALDVPFPVGANEFPNPAIHERGPFPYDSMNLVLGWDPAAGALRTRARPDPRAYVAGGARPVVHWREAISLMRGGHDFHRVALLEGPPPPLDGRSGTARIVRYEPEEVTAEVQSEGRGLLVFAEPWYPGWRATVNGVAAPVLPANGWMRAVAVPPGPARVVLTYRSRYLLAGAGVSLLAIGSMAAALVRGRRRKTPAA